MSASSEFVVYCGSGVGSEPSPWMRNAGFVGTPEKHPLMINTWSDLRLNLPTCMYDMPIASIIDHLHCRQSINALQSVGILVVGVAYVDMRFGIVALIPPFLFKLFWIEWVMV